MLRPSKQEWMKMSLFPRSKIYSVQIIAVVDLGG